jgi:hypothetical protein
MAWANLPSSVRLQVLEFLTTQAQLQVVASSKQNGIQNSFGEIYDFSRQCAREWAVTKAKLDYLKRHAHAIPCLRCSIHNQVNCKALGWRSARVTDIHLANFWGVGPLRIRQIREGAHFFEFVYEDEDWLLDWQRQSNEDTHGHPAWCLLHSSKLFRARYCKPLYRNECEAVILFFVHNGIEITMLLCEAV